ncbi:AI-2E family transporter [Halomicroarcula sp. GCM10025709]|uniref:AI-2E family transporter n=1 Tax=Haloarcula TaxID=2237 RepID=UPI0024C3B2FF|nr:AI-2E family transporter [Halomicroarcula sp. YJ-61-S]
MIGDDDSASISFLRVLLLGVGVLSIALVLPFLQFVLAAGLLAYLVEPVHDRLSNRVWSTVAALLTMVATGAVVLVPLFLIVVVALEQAVSVLQHASLPDIAAVEALFRRWIGPEVDLPALAGPLARAAEAGFRGLIGNLAGALGTIPAFLVGSVVFLFSFFYLLRDGDDLVDWLRAAAPLDPAVADELLGRIDDLLWAAVVGNVVVAGVQAILTVFGFLVIGFDNIIFWGVVTFALSLLPVIGASVVWLPAMGYLFAVGRIPAAVGLLVYGSVVISGSDNVVRPLAMQRGARLNPGLLVLGIFGGVAVFGFLGLFVGPVLIGLCKELVELLGEERAH